MNAFMYTSLNNDCISTVGALLLFLNLSGKE